MNCKVTGEGEGVKKTFEHRHENKSCSACPEDQLKPFYFLNFEFKFANFQILNFFLVSSFCLTFRHFFNNSQ